MSILKKKASVDMVSVEELETKISSLTEKNGELASKVATFELKEKLQNVATKIGFAGDVSALMVEGVTYETAMESMVGNLEVTTEEDGKSFPESASTEVGDGGNEEGFAAKTQDEAISFVKAEHNLLGRDAVIKAQELYPEIF